MDNKRPIKDLADLYQLVPGSAPPAEPTEKKKKAPLFSLVTLHVRRETKGRKGKGVTTVFGFHHTQRDLESLARDLKALCSAGGTVKDDVIEVQGDHRAKIGAHLKGLGYKVIVHQ
jgi:translation initiation factor 1